MENTKKLLTELSQTDWEVSFSRGEPIIQQTKRNEFRKRLLEALRLDLEASLAGFANFYFVDDQGLKLALEIENTNLGKKVEENEGFVSLLLDVAFKPLSYSAYTEAENYEIEQKAKQEAKQAKLAEKEALEAKRLAKKTQSLAQN